MKTITPQLIGFALAAIVLTIGFRYFLSYGIGIGSALTIALAAIIYVITMFLSGWYLGKKEENYLPISDVGFRFHLVTYLVHIIISELWFILGFNSNNESIGTVHTIAVIWGVVVILHFIMYLSVRKHAVKSLGKENIFE